MNFPRTAVVTGSDSGIGRAVAVALAAAGMNVGITYHTDRDGAQDSAREVRDNGADAYVRHLDLTDLPHSSAVIDELAAELGGVDVLVNCSGTGTAVPVMEMDFATWREVLSVNLDGAFLCTQRAVRHMIDAGRGGRIINITSVHEHAPKFGAAPYCASKAGLGGLTKVLALELAQYGITANSVAPGEISTPMTGQTDEEPRAKDRPGVPGRRPGDAREVAAVVSFLASPEASYVTGSSYVVDGGMLLMGPEANARLQSGEWTVASGNA
ncbi:MULTISPECIES: SDR family oxidoreductase [Rhodococcus]|uniref:3-oxoacyl-[acyl-carrier-protein] reductase MabA n=1 Tax=Rhodococcus oxybenzonivorans TaxID=1990687 RepID=A0AAE4UXM8_9NOCA|nr:MULTISPECIES: SDR family oxidoreductase [Rhodococcus]MDV7242165.1 SDR family oxidoreductase [Rhodococcus oxybenzonivorans]MDV7264632.1 SDR family oxidoreductase [Rhodococcus oxybenzonivorans]MDV7276340.1 SDR family oxidoreductase [Rhodococcus oxybenzonivorans]MDV7331653.1 SDR family oxidoreductase [Rhodococcus oxybenzonivorans]MDV7343875.1 SDR family oxidoreductase [Rhodococcus oxybenzonivorans]